MDLKSFFTLTILLSLTSCEMPRQTKRELGFTPTNFSSTNTFTDYGDNEDRSADSGSNSGDNTNTDSTFNLEIPDDANHCQWSTNGTSNFSFNHSIIGNYNVCRSQSSSKKIYFQLATPISSGARLCFIPVSRIGMGDDTTYVGGPHCDYVYTNSKIYAINFSVTRYPTGNSNPHIDGIIILKDESAMYAAPHPYNVNYYGTSLVAGAGAEINHYNAYYGCINALERFGSSAYCQIFETVGQFINHYPL